MTLTPQDAAAALADIEQVRVRSVELRQYRTTAPHFFLWALIWLVGYGASDLAPQFERIGWPVLVVLGWFGSILLGRRANRHVDAARMKAFWGKFWRLALVVMAFAVATLAVLLARNGLDVTVLTRTAAEAADIESAREHRRRLPGPILAAAPAGRP